jgi:hypothetical protein
VAEESAALYQSIGLVFEWYQGGQPYRHQRSVSEGRDRWTVTRHLMVVASFVPESPNRRCRHDFPGDRYPK